ncbi:MAG: hypothetical protein KatS3mg003_1282 [Candidatus Nitrosocaldaceae archaeon]|nr:MAG: hypothetical protein KatS3mg003_1282 [Candidatus Nitrosocaldaceae archaeon]
MNAIRKYLLLFKWAYDCDVMNVNNFDDFIKRVTG